MELFEPKTLGEAFTLARKVESILIPHLKMEFYLALVLPLSMCLLQLVLTIKLLLSHMLEARKSLGPQEILVPIEELRISALH